MSPEAYEVLAANSFPEERRRYYLDLAAEADLRRAYLQLEAEANGAQQRTEAERWARRLGLTSAEAPLIRALLHAPDRDHRQRAAALLCTALRRRQEAAA